MSSLNKVDIKHCVITPADQNGSINLEDLAKTNSHDFAAVKSVVHVDYFEDILSPSVTAYVKISETSNVLSKLEGKDLKGIRGYERVDMQIGVNETDTFDFSDRERNPLFVTSIEDINRTESQATYTLALSTIGNLRNEGSRCVKHYPRATIKAHVEELSLIHI